MNKGNYYHAPVFFYFYCSVHNMQYALLITCKEGSRGRLSGLLHQLSYVQILKLILHFVCTPPPVCYLYYVCTIYYSCSWRRCSEITTSIPHSWKIVSLRQMVPQYSCVNCPVHNMTRSKVISQTHRLSLWLLYM